jgi:hypothetical protein
MRTCRFWLNTLIWSSQYNPAPFVELLMLLLAMVLLVVWSFVPHWAYLVLSLSYGIGASVSISVREAIARSPQAQVAQLTTIVLIITSFYVLFA